MSAFPRTTGGAALGVGCHLLPAAVLDCCPLRNVCPQESYLQQLTQLNSLGPEAGS